MLVPAVRIASGALATSADYFSRREWRGRSVTPIVDKMRPHARALSISATVLADTCMLADALTKVILLRGPRGSGPIRRLGGVPFILRAGDPAAPLARVA